MRKLNKTFQEKKYDGSGVIFEMKIFVIVKKQEYQLCSEKIFCHKWRHKQQVKNKQDREINRNYII